MGGECKGDEGGGVRRGSISGQVVFLGLWQVAHSSRVIGLSRI